MKHRFKGLIILLTAIMVLSLVPTVKPATATGPEYSLWDMGAINEIIENNGLNWTKWNTNDPAPPSNWTGVIWDKTGQTYRIQELRLSGYSLSGDLDLTKLERLKILYCSNTSLTGLNVAGLTSLEEIRCTDSNLTSLTLENLSSLQSLSCGANGQLANLTLTDLPALTTLHCGACRLTDLEVKNLTALEDFQCSANQMTGLDVSGLDKLKLLACYDNQLTNLNVSGLSSLDELYCYENQLTDLDLGGLGALTRLACYNNQLTNLNVDDLTSLEHLYCLENQLTGLDVSALDSLLLLNCKNNKLKYLVLNNNASYYEGIDVSYNNLTGTAAVTGKTINWDGTKYIFDPQNSLPTYTITFDPQGGIVTPAAGTTDTAGKLAVLPVPTRAGYSFVGWFTASTGGAEVTTETIFGEDSTIYARWQALSAAPVITIHPDSRAVLEGKSVTLTVAAESTDGGLLTYRWKKDGEELPAATGASYTIASAAATDAGSYTVVVTNTVTGSEPASMESNGAVLTVINITAAFSATAEKVKEGETFAVTMTLSASADNIALAAFQAGFTFDDTLVKLVNAEANTNKFSTAWVTYTEGDGGAANNIVSFQGYSGTVGTAGDTVVILTFEAISKGTAKFAVTEPIIVFSETVEDTPITAGEELGVEIVYPGAVMLIPATTYRGVPTGYQVLQFTIDVQPASGSAYCYDGVPMYYSPKLSNPDDRAFVYLLMVEDDLTAAAVMAKIAEKEDMAQANIDYNGDVNGDDKVNILDAQIASDLATGNKFMSGFDPCTMRMRFEADINGDIKISAADARAIQYYIHYHTFEIK